MSSWVIGDIHGCFYTLMKLLDKIAPTEEDHITFLGDYVNKGAHSTECLAWLYNSKYSCVLGNHDLSWIYHLQNKTILPTMAPLLTHPQSQDIIAWMKHLPWSVVNEQYKAIMVHAGLDPLWTLEDIHFFSNQASYLLCHDPGFIHKIKIIHNATDMTTLALSPIERAAWIFTHIRFITHQGNLSHIYTAPPQEGLTPWFSIPHHHQGYRVYFGHWAALEAQWAGEDYCSLDGGAAYGKSLVAYNIDTSTYVYQSREERDV